MINEIMANNILDITNLLSYVRGKNGFILTKNLDEELNNIILKDNIENKFFLEKEFNSVNFLFFKDCYIKYIFDIEKANRFIKENKTIKYEKIEIEKIRTSFINQYLNKNYNFKNLKKEPIILYESEFAKNKYLLVDGRHRIENCLNNNEKYINAYIIKTDDIDRIAFYKIYKNLHCILKIYIQNYKKYNSDL